MNVPAGTVSQIAHDEGFRSRPYRDTENKLTIGYGCNLDNGISRESAGALLLAQVEEHADELDRWMRTTHGLELGDQPDPVQSALVNMCFNLGMPRLSRFKRMWAAVAAGEWNDAAREALDSKWATQVGARAQRIADMLREGNNP